MCAFNIHHANKYGLLSPSEAEDANKYGLIVITLRSRRVGGEGAVSL